MKDHSMSKASLHGSFSCFSVRVANTLKRYFNIRHPDKQSLEKLKLAIKTGELSSGCFPGYGDKSHSEVCDYFNIKDSHLEERLKMSVINRIKYLEQRGYKVYHITKLKGRL